MYTKFASDLTGVVFKYDMANCNTELIYPAIVLLHLPKLQKSFQKRFWALLIKINLLFPKLTFLYCLKFRAFFPTAPIKIVVNLFSENLPWTLLLNKDG